VVVKPMGASVRRIPYFSGAADLGQPHLALIIDAGAVIEAGLGAHDRSSLPMSHAGQRHE
jgi:chemotaxis protein histidine kinase CheA